MAESSKLFPDTPWWTNLVAIILTAVAMMIATRASVPSTGGPPSVGTLITDTALFFPHALILFGILADMFTYEGVYSIPSLIGILSIFLNKGLDFFWAGISAMLDKAKTIAAVGTGTGQSGGAVTNYTGCYVQGFEVEALKSKFSSQTLVVTATILVYYIMDLLMNKGIGSAFASIFVGVILFLAQVSSMSMGGCFEETGLATNVLTSLANGTIIGGLAYGIVEAYFPARLPSKALPSYPRVSLNDLKVDESGKLVDESGQAWVTLPDGSVIPDTCSAAGTDANASSRSATSPGCPKK